MIKKKIIVIFMVIVILFQSFIPILNKCYAMTDIDDFEESKNIEYTNMDNANENILDEKEDNMIENEILIEECNSEIDIKEDEQIKIKEEENLEDVLIEDVIIEEATDTAENEDLLEKRESEEILEEYENIIEFEEQTEEIEINVNDVEENEKDIEVTFNEDYDISVATSTGSGTGAGNEAEFSSAFYNTSVGELTISNDIRLNSIYTLNHNLRIDSSSQSGNNALQLSTGCSIIVPDGCVLTLDEIVIDGRQFGNTDGKVCVTVKSGGILMLTGHSIVDGGAANWGINVEPGGQLHIESAQISYCDRGIVLQGNSYCSLASDIAVSWWGNTGKTVDITHNNVGIYCGSSYNGTLVVNHVSNDSNNINFENNTYGIQVENHSGSITIENARMVNNGWAIYSFGNITINFLNAVYNARGIVNAGGNIYFKSGNIYADNSSLKEFGIYNISGTVNMQGGNIYNNVVGVWNTGTINMSNGIIGSNTTGVENYGTFNLTGGALATGTYGVKNEGIFSMAGGSITDYAWGAENIATFNMSAGTITNNSVYGVVNSISDTILGQLYITGGSIINNTDFDIFHLKSDTDGGGATYGGLRIETNGTISSKIALAAYNNYIYTGSYTPVLTSITLGDIHLERKIIRTNSTPNAFTMFHNSTVTNKGGFYCKDNATGYANYVVLWTDYTVTTYHKTISGVTLGSTSQTYAYKNSYTTSASTFAGYELSSSPSNSSGTVTGDIAVTYYYKEKPVDKNVAIVNYKDLLSGIQSAVYWYNSSSNSFSGTGTTFVDGKIFEDYGYYKVTVTNGVGLSKTITFALNDSSI